MLCKDFSLPYWLDLVTCEGNCFVKSARDLTITWGDNLRYWLWEPQPDSWFPDSACLQIVCWFEVHGAPVTLSLSTSNGQHTESQRFFSGKRTPLASKVAPLRSLDTCLWMEREMRVSYSLACWILMGGGRREVLS